MDDRYRPTVHTQADLEEVWRHLMGPWGFGGRSIWMLRLDADRQPVPVITEITECDAEPYPGFAASLAEVLGSLAQDGIGGTFAFLVSRPGRGIHDSDRMWARFLHDAGARADVPLEVVHLATDAGVVPLPPDELTPRRTA